jgi:hypothetical protein
MSTNDANARIVSSKVLATFWGVSTKTVERLAAGGLIPRAKKGQYDLLQCNLAYIEYIKKNAESDFEGTDWAKRRTKALALKEEELLIKHRLTNQQTRGETLSLNEMIIFVSGLMVTFRTALLQLPSEVGFELSLTPDQEAVIRERAEELLHEIQQASVDFEGESESDSDRTVGENQQELNTAP